MTRLSPWTVSVISTPSWITFRSAGASSAWATFTKQNAIVTETEMWRSVSNMIQTAFRLLNHWPQIEQMIPRVEKAIKDIEQLWPRVQTTMEQTIKLANDVQALAAKVAPELIAPTQTAPQQQFPPTYDVKWLQTSLNTLVNAGLTVD